MAMEGAQNLEPSLSRVRDGRGHSDARRRDLRVRQDVPSNAPWSVFRDSIERRRDCVTTAARPRPGASRRELDTGRCPMKAIVVTDEAVGTAGMTLAERPDPQAALNDIVVEVHASGFTSGELTWPSTWTDRLGRDRTPSIPGHELAGLVSALGNGTTGLSVGQR